MTLCFMGSLDVWICLLSLSVTLSPEELGGHSQEQERYLNHVCECQYVCLDQLEVQGTDLHPMSSRDEGHFPGRPFLSVFLWGPGYLALVQFNFFRAQRRFLSPISFLFAANEEPAFIFSSSLTPQPTINRITFCLSAKCCIFIFPLPFVPYS